MKKIWTFLASLQVLCFDALPAKLIKQKIEEQTSHSPKKAGSMAFQIL